MSDCKSLRTGESAWPRNSEHWHKAIPKARDRGPIPHLGLDRRSVALCWRRYSASRCPEAWLSSSVSHSPVSPQCRIRDPGLCASRRNARGVNPRLSDLFHPCPIVRVLDALSSVYPIVTLSTCRARCRLCPDLPLQPRSSAPRERRPVALQSHGGAGRPPRSSRTSVSQRFSPRRVAIAGCIAALGRGRRRYRVVRDRPGRRRPSTPAHHMDASSRGNRRWHQLSSEQLLVSQPQPYRRNRERCTTRSGQEW